jgi:phosphatidylserine synthase 1
MDDSSPRQAGYLTSGSEGDETNSAGREERMYRKWYSTNYANGENCPVVDVSIPWLYESHSVWVLSIVSILIWYAANRSGPFETLLEALHACIPYVVSIFLAVGLFAFPSGPFIRPHPIVWKIIFGISVLYLLFLVVLLVPSPSQSRALLHAIDPSVGTPFELPLYAEDCSLTWDIMKDKLDVFVLAHFFGWLVKALFFRHRIILWVFSITWELVELALIYMVPNFAECWWDQWILDVLLCNGLGIECGLWICKNFEFRKYAWTGVLEQSTLVSKLKRFALQFTPASWNKIEWESAKTTKRYLQVQLIIILSILNDLNAFMLKLFLYVPTTHYFNIVRLFFMVVVAAPSYRQGYLFFVDDKVKRLGTQAIVLVMITIAELALVFKAGSDFNIPTMPLINKISIAAFLTVYVAVSILLLRKSRKAKNSIKSE